MANENLNAAIGEVVVNGKKFWESRTFWVNAIAAAAILAQTKWGFVIGPETQALVLTGVNLFLRKITDRPIVW